MSLQMLAPTERSEHLIYSILPLSIATWLASQLGLSDPIQILAAVVSISSFGTIILYEFTPDQWPVNGFLRWRTRSRPSLKEAILIFNILAKTWKEEPTKRSDWRKDFLDEQVKNQVSINVNGPFIRKRTWRIRSSVYLLVSIWFIFGALGKYLTMLLGIENIENLMNPNVYSNLSFLNNNIFWLTIGVFILMLLEMIIRHRKLVSNIDQLSRFTYLNRTLSSMKLRDPSFMNTAQDEIGIQKLNYQSIDTEMNILKELLRVDDWSGFHQGWDRAYHWIHRETVRFTNEYFMYEMMKPFANIYAALRERTSGNSADINEIVRMSIQQVEWICYFIDRIIQYRAMRKTKRRYPKIRESAISYDLPLPSFYGELLHLCLNICNFTEENFENPNDLLRVAAELSTIKRDGTEAAIMWAVSHLGSGAKIYNAGAEAGFKVLLQELAKKESTYGLSSDILTQVILRGFQLDGVGSNISGQELSYDVLKKMKELRPENMDIQWQRAFARFIAKLQTDDLLNVLDDRAYITPLVDLHIIHTAMKKLLEAHKQDKTVKQKLGRFYGIS
ncbi:MAG: hypothetical protein ACFFF4_16965 [Candidatus Thorarchaeota archaeon]